MVKKRIEIKHAVNHRIRNIYRTINRPFGIARSFSLRHIGSTGYPVSKFSWRL